MSRPRVCFFAPFLWPLWSGGRVPFTGGAEVQQELLARGLAARGVDTTVVSCDYGQPSPVTVHGVRVLKTYRVEAGLPVLRFFWPRLPRTIAALHAARADVYYSRGAGLEAGLAHDVARARRAAFVFAAAHDQDTRRDLPRLPNPRDRWWFSRALRGAAAVIAQSEWQRESLRREWGLEATVIRNLVEPAPAAADPGGNGVVVWLSTYKPGKRPAWFVDLARAFPSRSFVMCGTLPPAYEGTAEWNSCVAAAKDLPNLEVRGFVEHGQVAALYRSAALFVHTSPAEGFPNTLLEAWSHGVPTLSCVDPDGVIARGGFGEVVADAEGFVAALGSWLGDPERRRAAGARARAYVEREHAPEAVLGALRGVFERAAAART